MQFAMILIYIFNSVLIINVCASTVLNVTNVSTPKHNKSATKTRISNTAHQNGSVILRMATPCQTPNLDDGYCLSIRECPTLLKQLGNPKAKSFIMKSMCGPKNENKTSPRVCCGKHGNFISTVRLKNPLPKKCGIQTIVNPMKNRIFGGNEAGLGEFPWMARIVHKNDYGVKSFGCSAFLIHPKFVLTAAHCIKNEYVDIFGNIFEILLGEHNIDTDIDCIERKHIKICADPPQRIRVESILVNNQYNHVSKNQHNDIALIHLRKGARINDYVRPICLQKTTSTPQEYWISGWGKTATEEESAIKLKVALPPFSLKACADKYLQFNLRIVKTQVCAGGHKNKDSCTGDSGGPLMSTYNGTNWYASGIVSYGFGCGKEGWPGVYTNVPSYYDWVVKQIHRVVSIRSRGPIKSRRSKIKTTTEGKRNSTRA